MENGLLTRFGGTRKRGQTLEEENYRKSQKVCPPLILRGPVGCSEMIGKLKKEEELEKLKTKKEEERRG